MATPPGETRSEQTGGHSGEHTGPPAREYWTQELSRPVEYYEKVAQRRGESVQDVAARELAVERRDVLKNQLNVAIDYAAELQRAVAERNATAQHGGEENEGALEAQTRYVEELLKHAPIIVPREFDKRSIRELFEVTYDTDSNFDATIRSGVVHELSPKAAANLVSTRQRHGLQEQLSVLVLGYYDGRFAVGRASLLDVTRRALAGGHVRLSDLDQHALAKLNPQQRAAIEQFAQRGRKSGETSTEQPAGKPA